MADIEITVDGGTSKRLLTAGKYCDRNITVTATGGGGEPEPPDDGKTRLYITIPANSMPDRPPPRNQVPLYIQQTVDRGVTIDWGDGSEPETLPGTGNVNTAHTYEQAGDYVISLDPADGCELGFGDGTSHNVMADLDSERYYSNILSRVIIGNKGVERIEIAAFAACESLEKITIPEGVMYIEGYSFSGCSSLMEVSIPNSAIYIGEGAFYGCIFKSIIIPNDVKSIDHYAFSSCNSLLSIIIPDGVSYINDGVFSDCSSFTSISIPYNVISIGVEAFSQCISMKECHLLPTTPPYLANVNAFSDIPSDCIIYVPVGSLEAYQSATNWSTYADKMREEGT